MHVHFNVTKHCLCLQMLHVHAEASSHPEHFDSINGITPAMRNARQRHFNNVDIPFEAVKAVEDDLLQIVQVHLLLPGQCIFCIGHQWKPCPCQMLCMHNLIYLGQFAPLACRPIGIAVIDG